MIEFLIFDIRHQTPYPMTHLFEPFTPERFKTETGLTANDNEAIYLRWVNSQINYANFLQMRDMNQSLKEIITLLKEGAYTNDEKLARQ